MAEDKDLYDFSNYSKDHSLYSDENRKALGKMKHECPGVPISEFVGLRLKIYSILLSNEVSLRRAKGVTYWYVSNKKIRNKDFREVLSKRSTMSHPMNMIRAEGHNIYNLRVNKISLSPLDTKRCISSDGIHTLAYGHSDFKKFDKRIKYF